MNLEKVHKAYFLGIGGIGMSALARYFNAKGVEVSGYDRTQTSLTDQLAEEGIEVSFSDSVEALAASILRGADNLLVVYTPAVPSNSVLLNYFRNNGFALHKRAEVLGWITRDSSNIAVAGTHGKTTTSTLVAHMLTVGNVSCNAFLGGISSNYNSNVILDPESNITVVEADEYDRSFLQLHPNISVVTSTEADHLDIYGEAGELTKTFAQFVEKTNKTGCVIYREGIVLDIPKDLRSISYAVDSETADVSAREIKVRNGFYYFELFLKGKFEGLFKAGMPGRHNIENALAAIAVGLEYKLPLHNLQKGIETFKGVKRRFEYHIQRADRIYIDDYAHHPTELKSCIGSVRELYPEGKITGVFQPHLYSRTRDFMAEFAHSLEGLNELVLMDIYPAREEPIEGVSSAELLERVQMEKKHLWKREELVEQIVKLNPEILLTMGAGDIDKMIEPLKTALNEES